MMSYILTKVSNSTSNSKYVDRAGDIERFLQERRAAKASRQQKATAKAQEKNPTHFPK